jgi:hypothetical protein
MKLIVLMLFFPTLSWALSPEEEECKKDLDILLYKKGLISESVCMDDSRYPNISIQTTKGNFDPGASDANANSEDINALKNLTSLLNNLIDVGTDGKKEVVGYTDGMTAVFTSFDENLFESTKDNGKNGVSKTLKSNINTYVENITDLETKKVVSDLLKNKQHPIVIKFTKENGSSDRLIPENSELGKIADILRNYELSNDRAKKFCEKFNAKDSNDLNDCLKNVKGVTSPHMIKSPENLPPGKKNGACKERRGVAYNFYFPDDVKPFLDLNPDQIEPNFKIAERKWQNKMHLASTLEMMRNIKNNKEFQEFHSENPEDLLSHDIFWDVKKDKERFKNLYAGTGCEKNEYSVDATRRKYWNIAHDISLTKDLFKQFTEQNKNRPSNLNPINKDKMDRQEKSVEVYSQLLDKIENADYEDLVSDPLFSNLLKWATIPDVSPKGDYMNNIKLLFNDNLTKGLVSPSIVVEDTKNADYKNEVTKKLSFNKTDFNPNLLNDYDIRMIGLIRTMVLGRSSDTGIDQSTSPSALFKYNKSATEQNQEFKLIEDGVYQENDEDKLENLGVNVSKKVTRKYLKDGRYERYPDAKIYDSHDFNNMVPSDIHNCNSSIDALADFATNGANNSNLISVKKDDEVALDFLNVQNVSTIEKGNVRGWVCTHCGSGIHVHSDGRVEFLSRQKNNNNTRNPLASQSFEDTQNVEFGLANLEHLNVYSIPNCKDCDCLKNKSGDEFKKLLAGNAHSMINNSYIKDNQFNVTSSDSCLFVPPVPHSCSYDPKGDSLEREMIKEKQEEFYCTLKSTINKNFPTDVNTDLLKQDLVIKNCQSNIGNFPYSEVACGYNAKWNTNKNNNNSNSNHAVED